MNGRLALVVINYKNYSDTIECLESLMRYPMRNVTIFLLDNGSPNESSAEIQRWLDLSKDLVKNQVTLDPSELGSWAGFADGQDMGVVFVKMPENTGFAGGNNFVINRMLDKYVYFLLFNNDAVCVNDAVNIMRRAMEENPDIGAATCRINHYSAPERLQQMGGRLRWYGHFHRYDEGFLNDCCRNGRSVVSVTFATGCVLLLRNDLLKRHGALSERIFFGEEDVELCLRYKRLGVKIASILDALVLHKGGGSQKAASASHVDAAYATSMIGRAVLLRRVYRAPRWFVWFHAFKAMMTINIMIRRGLGLKRTRRIMKVIDRYVGACERIDRDTYLGILNEF